MITERMSLYLDYLQMGETVALAVLLSTIGLMGLWYVWIVSPIPFLRRLSGAPFWGCVLVLELGLSICSLLIK